MPSVFDWIKVAFCFALILMLHYEEQIPEGSLIVVAICWSAICISGILLSLPLFLMIGIGAGAAQADWMSDGFAIIVFIVIPTGLSIFWSVFIRRKILRVFRATTHPEEEV